MCVIYIYTHNQPAAGVISSHGHNCFFWAITVKGPPGPPSRCVEKIVLDGLPHGISWDELTAKVSHHLNDY